MICNSNSRIGSIVQSSESLTLDDYTWEKISEISKAGKAQQCFKIGDEKEFSVTENDEVKTFPVQIIGFDHDTPANTAEYGRAKAGITFQLGNPDSKGEKRTEWGRGMMNQTATTNGGWQNSYMRNTVLPGKKQLMPDDLKSVIIQVNKLTSAGQSSSSIVTTADDLWLLSEIEVFGTAEKSYAGEGSQYQFYKSGGKKSRTLYDSRGSSGGATTLQSLNWWERSPRKASNTNFCGITGFGESSGATASGDDLYIVFCFCI